MEKATAVRTVHPAISPVSGSLYSSKNLSEDDVLALCDLFLTPGIHYVSCTSVHDGRRIMKLFIDQLSWYRTIGYIDHAHALHYEHGMNLYDIFVQYHERATLNQALDSFFIHSFEYDFLGIINARTGRPKHFARLFIEKLIYFALDKRIPIVCIGV